MNASPKPSPDPTPQSEMPLSEGMKAFIAHLIELRDRMLRAVIVLVVLMVLLFPFASELFTLFATPVLKSLPAGQTMIATGAISPFFIPVKLAALTALFIAMPYLLYQLWAFIAPGLYQHEKRLAVPLIVSSSALFYIGAGFAYFVVIPAVFHFMAMFAPQGVSFMPDIGSYLDFAISLFFTFGMAFEVPVAVVLLSAVGVVTPDQLAAKRRYAILVAFIVGAVFTPPDILSQFMLAVPVWLLYELGILVARLVVKEKATHAAQEDDEDDEAQALLPAASPGALSAAAAGALTHDETHATQEGVGSSQHDPENDIGTEVPADGAEGELDDATPLILRDDRNTSLQDAVPPEISGSTASEAPVAEPANPSSNTSTPMQVTNLTDTGVEESPKHPSDNSHS
jgi:sec-independent protein translocase protein TatC